MKKNKLLICLMIAFSMLIPSACPNAEGYLAAEYNFDSEGAYDTSGNGFDGMVMGAEYEDGAYRFAKGSGSHIQIPAAISDTLKGAEAITVSCWFKSEGTPGNSYYMLFIPIDGGKSGVELFINATNLRVAGRSTPSDAWLSKKYDKPENDRWNHVAAIWNYKAKKIDCYLNGVLMSHIGGDNKAAFGADSYSPGTPNQANTSISQKTAQSEFNGLLDEIKIYTTALSEEEIVKLASSKELDNSLTNEEITRVLEEKIDDSLVLALDFPDVFKDKKRERIDWDNVDVTPILKDDRTLVPLRMLGESFGMKVSYDEGSKTAELKKEGITVTVIEGQSYITVNGDKMPIPVPAEVMNGRFMLPLRHICEAMGSEVLYHDGLIIINEKNLFDLNNKDDVDCLNALKERLTVLNYTPPVRNHQGTEVVVDYSDPATNIYIASPSIIRMSDGSLIASHDFNGPKNDMSTIVFRSTDDGATWTRMAKVEGCTWATLFEHNDSLYLMGTSEVFGSAVIHKSDDFGKTWTVPSDSKSGIIIEGGDGGKKIPPNFHTAPVNVVKHNGRIYRAYEDALTGTSVSDYHSLIVSAPLDCDLLDASNWMVTNELKFTASNMPADWQMLSSGGWLEGNVVVAPNGEIWNMLRMTSPPATDKGAILKLSADNKTIYQDSEQLSFEMAGASHKFVIKYDEKSGKYFSVVNENTDTDSYNQRNILSLAYSEDLIHWDVAETLLTDKSILSWNESILNTGFQYVDFFIEGDDIRMLVRQSTDGGANYHDSNHITYYKIEDFRKFVK